MSTADPLPPKCYFTCDDSVEELTHRDPDSAIEAYLDGIDPAADLLILQEPLKVYRYQQRAVSAHVREHFPGLLLEKLLEDLDEEYGEPGAEGTAMTPRMEEAARAFVDTVLAEYHVWACEKAGEEAVDARAWIAAHRPEWLAKPEGRS